MHSGRSGKGGLGFRRALRWTAAAAFLGMTWGLVEGARRNAPDDRDAGSAHADTAPSSEDRPPATGPDRDQDRNPERKDASAWGVVLIGIGIAAGVGLVLLASGWLVGMFAPREPRVQLSRAPIPPALPARAAVELPPAPRLQANPPEDWQVLRARDEARLNSYGWVDRNAQVVHVPIGLAMDLIVQRGLPQHDQEHGQGAAPAPSPPSTAGQSIPGQVPPAQAPSQNAAGLPPASSAQTDTATGAEAHKPSDSPNPSAVPNPAPGQEVQRQPPARDKEWYPPVQGEPQL